MGCPHGNGPASSCSQCLGASAIRVEQVGEGLFRVGDRLLDRTRGVKTADYGTVQTQTAVARCDYCRKAGHKTEKCRERITNETLAAHILGVHSQNVAKG